MDSKTMKKIYNKNETFFSNKYKVHFIFTIEINEIDSKKEE